MAWELSITSAPRGLKPGSAGFCPVAHTRTMPPVLIERLESISGYRHLEIGTSVTGRNPVVRSHTILRLGGETYHVLSRICDAGRDYSGRSNRFAYHLVLRPQELPPGGPAVLLQTPGLLQEQWDGQLCLISQEKEIPQVTSQPKPCTSWEQVWGDAGWAGVLLQKFLNDSQKNIYFVYPAEVDILKLFEEAIALLPESHRWKVTFSTFDQGLREAVPCRWCAIHEQAPEAREILNRRGLEVWDLRQKRGPAPASPEVLAAREGRQIELSAPQKVPTPLPPATVPRPVAPPAGFAIGAPIHPKEDTPFLQVVDDHGTPPPIEVASRRILTPRTKQLPLHLLINLAMLFVGLVIGVAMGFVLWSGLVMPPLLPRWDGKPWNIRKQQISEKLPQNAEAKKSDRDAKEKPPTAGAQTAERPQPGKKDGGESGEKPTPQAPKETNKGEESPPPNEENKEDSQGLPKSTEQSPQKDLASQNGKNAASPVVPASHEAEGVQHEVVAIPASALMILQIGELKNEAPAKTGLPGGQTAVSWQWKPVWSLENWQENTEIAILKVIDPSGQPSYYVGSVKPMGTVDLKLGQVRTLEISPIQGIRLELHCVDGWHKGESGDEYCFRSDGKDYLQLRIEQKTAKITVQAKALPDYNADHKLPDEIPAEIGFYLTDKTRIWISRIKLRILTGQAGTAGPREGER
ncbi:MAG: GAP1-N2 domain-containing protein [Thermogutta sp.]